ncbi:xylosyltransferase 1-like isoform X1 [Asterias amurensis]|uniref:xylosyltransferase 1-like isoform X1 n=1 Tax=Asterias amurensis TaxID=7602 RepID=UPI003AB7718D
MAVNSVHIHRSSRLCYRYRRAVYVATFIITVQLVAAWTIFFALENAEERGRRDEMVWSADRELGGRPGGKLSGALLKDTRQKQPMDKLQFASIKNNNKYREENESHTQKITNPPGTLKSFRKTQTLGIFKDVMQQFKNSSNQVKKTLKDDSLPLDRRRKFQQSKLSKLKSRTDLEQAGAENFKKDDSVDAKSKELALDVEKQHYRSTMVRVTPTGNITVQLEYFAKCAVEGRDAISALSRATTPQCKQQIADTVCDMPKGSLYPTRLPRYCSLEGKADNEIEDNPRYKIVDGKPVRIVYMLVIHGRALRQVKRLIRLLFHTDHYFYIHVDSRSDYLYREVARATKGFSNIRMTKWRLATIWGGASLLEVYLRCMEDLLNMEDWDWDFFINLSESDMPIKTNDYLVSFLSRYRKNNFLKSHGSDDERKDKNGKVKPGFIKKQGLDKTFFECDTHMWRLGDRQLPLGITLDGGSDWIVINRQFVEYLIMSTNELLTGLKLMYKYTLLPAESFFHTVLENSELCKTFVDNNLRVTNWKRKLGCQCQYKHIVDWCGCSPNDFKPEDLYKTKPNRPAYFARKFEPIINQAVINQLDSWLYGSYPVGTPGDRSYWQSLYHYEDSSTIASDVALTVYQSFIRLMAAHINLVAQGQPYDDHCAYSIKSSPKEVTMYLHNDDFRGLVVTVEGQTPKGTSDNMEVWLSKSSEYKVTNYIGPSTRLQKFQVGTEYDLKERVLRNFANIMGPTDSPIVFLKWKPGEQVLVTISWIDPTNHVAASFDTTVDHDKEETHHSPPFKKPLRPGKWYIKLLYQWMVVAEIEFLIVPLAFNSGKAILQADAVRLNSGVPNNKYVDKDFSSMKSLFQLTDSAPLIEEADKKAHLLGAGLHEWVDEVVGQHWSVLGFCVSPANATKQSDCKQFKACYSQSWSTLSPDPKADLKFIKSDGRIR